MSREECRRSFLKKSILAPVAVWQASRSAGAFPAESGGGFPTGRIGNLQISRIFLGCNQVSGYAHCRDLKYLSDLMRSYQSDDRILGTLEACERNGINTVLSDPFEKPVRLIQRYRKERGGKIQWISECHPQKPPAQMTLADLKADVMQVIDNGANAIYVQGAIGDYMVQHNKIEILAETVTLIRKNGLPAGIGSHSIEVPKAMLKAGIDPDFYMKTFHPDDYWSATPRDKRVEFNVDSGSADDYDNIWDINPTETASVMKQVKKPWIAFKVLAAGAVHPSKGFRYAFANGADFICVGMFDFQVPENAAIAREILAANLGRERPWCA